MAFSGFDFAAVEEGNKKTLQFSKTAPKYRTVRPGLNMLAKCSNPGCEAHKDLVWIMVGFCKKYSIA